mmetsp:Transcript_11871/g.28193  ORF Transcript_11871/g.28193 Transcript_11871/m.28193 type:complete len:367 (+) Transcript_11871:2322-3422(+)
MLNWSRTSSKKTASMNTLRAKYSPGGVKTISYGCTTVVMAIKTMIAASQYLRYRDFCAWITGKKDDCSLLESSVASCLKLTALEMLCRLLYMCRSILHSLLNCSVFGSRLITLATPGVASNHSGCSVRVSQSPFERLLGLDSACETLEGASLALNSVTMCLPNDTCEAEARNLRDPLLRVSAGAMRSCDELSGPDRKIGSCESFLCDTSGTSEEVLSPGRSFSESPSEGAPLWGLGLRSRLRRRPAASSTAPGSRTLGSLASDQADPTPPTVAGRRSLNSAALASPPPTSGSDHVSDERRTRIAGASFWDLESVSGCGITLTCGAGVALCRWPVLHYADFREAGNLAAGSCPLCKAFHIHSSLATV